MCMIFCLIFLLSRFSLQTNFSVKYNYELHEVNVIIEVSHHILYYYHIIHHFTVTQPISFLAVLIALVFYRSTMIASRAQSVLSKAGANMVRNSIVRVSSGSGLQQRLFSGKDELSEVSDILMEHLI